MVYIGYDLSPYFTPKLNYGLAFVIAASLGVNEHPLVVTIGRAWLPKQIAFSL